MSNPPQVGDANATRFIVDGLLVISKKDGKIVDFGDYRKVAPKWPGIPITNYRGKVITPGFFDTHIHYVQSKVVGELKVSHPMECYPMTVS